MSPRPSLFVALLLACSPNPLPCEVEPCGAAGGTATGGGSSSAGGGAPGGGNESGGEDAGEPSDAGALDAGAGGGSGGTGGGGSTDGGGGAGGGSAPAPSDGGATFDEFCTRGLCWETPRPGPMWWTDLHFVSATEAYAVSNDGHVARFDGARWTQLREGDGAALQGLWATAGDVWAVGAQGLVLRYRAGQWSRVMPSSPVTGTLRDVIGFSTGEVFIVGSGGLSLMWDGTALNALSTGTTQDLEAVWGTGPSALVAVGRNKTVLRFNGLGWSSMTPPPGAATSVYLTVTGASSSDFYVADSDAWHWNGTTWTKLANSPTNFVFFTLRLVGGRLWAGGWPSTIAVWDDALGSWTVTTSPATSSIWKIDGLASNDLWAVGNGGEFLRFTGTQWRQLRQGSRRPYRELAASADGRLVALAEQGELAERTDAGRWEPLPSAPPNVSFGPACTRAGGTWAVGGLELYALDAGAWVDVTPPGVSVGYLGCTGDSIFVSDYFAGTVHRFDGSTWSSRATGIDIDGLLGDGSSMWAFGGPSGVYDSHAVRFGPAAADGGVGLQPTFYRGNTAVRPLRHFASRNGTQAAIDFSGSAVYALTPDGGVIADTAYVRPQGFVYANGIELAAHGPRALVTSAFGDAVLMEKQPDAGYLTTPAPWGTRHMRCHAGACFFAGSYGVMRGQ